MATKPPTSIAALCREALLTFPDPLKAPASEVVALVIPRWTAIGGQPGDIHDHNVEQTRAYLKTKVGKPLTKERVLGYLRKVCPVPTMPGGGNAVAAGRGNKTPALAAVSGFTVAEIRRAKEFVGECGGMALARGRIDALEEIRA